MPRSVWFRLFSVMVLSGLLLSARGVTWGQAETAGHSEAAAAPAKADAPEKPGVSLAEARERARLLHDVYDGTLQTVHSRYFRDNDSGLTVPSRALEDVFSRVARRQHVSARWIAVNAQAMSLDHEPKDTFEKNAARALASGKQEFEVVESGRYRRAAPIALFASCLKCHAPPPMRPTGNRVAGLIISMAVDE